MTDLDHWIQENKRRRVRVIVQYLTRAQYPATLVTREPMVIAAITPFGLENEWWELFTQNGERLGESLQLPRRRFSAV